MKVVWLCHFSNQEVQDILKPGRDTGEIAPWITSLAKLLEKQTDIELHIISPHEYIRKYKHFTIRGIHYYFFNAHIPFWGRQWPGIFRFDYLTDFFFTKIKVRKVVNNIKPDIIHLHGAENAYYSSSVLQFGDKYPVLVTIQGFISHTTSSENYQTKQRIRYEHEILKTFVHFGYRTHAMGKEIKKHNPNAVLHWHHYPVPQIVPIKTEKKFDIVFFARITTDKGIEDLLKAVAFIKNKKPDVSLCIIGKATRNYMDYLKGKASDYYLDNNIFWAGFLPTQSDVYRLASAAKICVLPTYHDLISGTIIESLFLKVPVIAYNVGSIHEVNEKEEIIYLVDRGNIKGLAEAMIELLNDENLREERSEKGYNKALEMLDNTKIIEDLIFAYKEVINEFKRKQMPCYRS